MESMEAYSDYLSYRAIYYYAYYALFIHHSPHNIICALYKDWLIQIRFQKNSIVTTRIFLPLWSQRAVTKERLTQCVPVLSIPVQSQRYLFQPNNTIYVFYVSRAVTNWQIKLIRLMVALKKHMNFNYKFRRLHTFRGFGEMSISQVSLTLHMRTEEAD